MSLSGCKDGSGGDREEDLLGESSIQPATHCFEDCWISPLQNGCPPQFLDSWLLLNSLILRSELSVELVLGRRGRGRSRGVRGGVAGCRHHGLEPAVLLRGGRGGQEVGRAGRSKGGGF